MTQVLLQLRDPLLTDISDLTDPGADKILFWDDSAGAVEWLDLGTGLSITGTTISASGSSGTGTLGTIPKVTNATGPVYGDSIVSEASSVITLAGALTLSTSTTTTFTTPASSSVPTKINIPLYDPGAFGQILAMGITSGVATTARVFLICDGRTVEHQPSLNILSPDENQGAGGTWDGSNTLFRLVTTQTLALTTGGVGSRVDKLITTSTGIYSTGTIEIGHATDTTLSRVSAGVLAIEGVNILTTATGQPLDATLTALAAYNTDGLLTQTAADTFTGRTIAGTSNRIKVTNGNGVAGNPTIDIDSAYVGQTSITTLGTITTGTWTGSKITVPNGGTGLGTFTAHGVLMGNGASDLAVSTAGTAGQVFTSGGSSADGSYQDALGIPSSTTVLGSNVGLGTSYGNVGLSVSLPGTGTWDVVVEGGVALNITSTTPVTDHAFIQGKLRDTTNSADITSTVDRMCLLIGVSSIVYVSFAISGRITLSGAATVNLQMRYQTGGGGITVNSALCLTDTNIYYKKVAP